ncbi:MAG: hypothetical protein JW985_02980 [Alphaproteobacteria bacterium]|nr:hypothetical protein [Alphaproteobacteria bacterium]
MNIIYLKRKDLYEKVWSEPVIKLAKIYGLSDNGLHKICKKYKIPLPKVGHWAKIQNGYKSTKEKLTGNPDESIKINIRNNLITNPKKATIIPKFQISTVPDEIQNFHPLIKEIKQRMKEPRQYYSGAYHFKNMRLSKENWNRGMRIYDTALRAIENNFGKLNIDNDGIFFVIQAREMHIYLHEKINSNNITPQPTEKQKEEIKKNPWNESYIWPQKFEYIPTNIMTLSIEGGGDWYTVSRRNFSDGKKALEEQIGDFLAAIYKLGEIEKRAAVIDNRESCKRRREQNVAAQKRLEQELIKQKHDKLEEQLKNWHHAEDIRTFVNACIKRAAQNPESIKSFKEFNQWVKIAIEYANTFDVLKAEFGSK